jgi:hypothetical protein
VDYKVGLGLDVPLVTELVKIGRRLGYVVAEHLAAAVAEGRRSEVVAALRSAGVKVLNEKQIAKHTSPLRLEPRDDEPRRSRGG